MRRLAAAAALALALSGLAGPAMAAGPAPAPELSQLTAAPVDPAPNHHKIKPPAPGKSDLYLLFHGGFNGAKPRAVDASAAPETPTHSAPVLLKAGVAVAKVAKAKALTQPKQNTRKINPAPTSSKSPTASTAKTTKAKPPTLTPQQAQQQVFANPPRVHPHKYQ